MRTFVSLICILISSFLLSQNVVIEICGIRTNKGKIRVAVFKSHNDFIKEKPYYECFFDKNYIKKNKNTIKIDLKPGTYGIAVLDDENDNGKMDFTLVGIPQEGFGFSNYYTSGLIRPSFDDFKFVVLQGESNVEVKMRYIW
ncbi:MAG: DUF2141 domain-containing protein [Bacteroidales bacterium]|jgi:uncharacterized protein (DUF2141 family)|nr:DUF2141 domain-containing protein [Bacteroidales bacterium]HOL98810.1 DUF2141 domain-containing protein [Bacteroidales bacterium]HOM37028.1 DUF2141 domain-containing protein [Bacteroidales bacterium]HPD24653.1 DUF2141 domain-containing protein [Bacteroidales bacterium]HRT00398.1 DUF2141 domain-containing protein [Bacteroidales bacterium]